MSSIWTPNGEHEIKKQVRTSPPDNAQQSTAEKNDQDTAQKLKELEAQIRSTPAEDIIANHCYGLFQLAAIHLAANPPGVKEASLAIDAMGAIMQSLTGRLGEAEKSLHEGLTQLQFAYVQISKTLTKDQ